MRAARAIRRPAVAALAVALLVVPLAFALPRLSGSPGQPGATAAVDWTLVHVTGGDAVHAVAVSDGAVLAGTNYEGLFRVEGGTGTQPLAAQISALAAGPSSIAAGTRAGGVHVSTDGGATWATDASGLEAVDVYSLAFAGDDLYAGTSAGVFLRGASGWGARSSGLAARNVNALLATSSSLVAGTEHGAFASTDGGVSWAARSSGIGDVGVLALTEIDGTLVAGTRRGLVRSTDDGATWSAPPGLPAGPVRALASRLGPEWRLVFAGTTDGVYVSRDAGASWAPMPGLAGEAATVFSLALAGTCPEGVVAGTAAGVWRSPYDCGGPEPADDVAVTPQYEPVVVDVLANDADPDGDALTVVAVTQPQSGTATINGDGTVTYTPTHRFKDADAFTYTVSDGDDVATASVTILEDGCGEDGAVSERVDRDVEPAVGDMDPALAEEIHGVNCDVVVPAENVVDGG